jgi:L-aspartate oxidase
MREQDTPHVHLDMRAIDPAAFPNVVSALREYGMDPPPPPRPITPPSQASRQALWELAGIERSREGLERLQADPHPLARVVATCALLREESRGAHRRTDFPATDPSLDGHHVVIGGTASPAFEAWT